MQIRNRILIGTVCLERNRWSSRQPSFTVSEWLPRFAGDGFDGVELWGFHYHKVDAAEQARLQDAGPIDVFNSYVGFDDEATDALLNEADAVSCLKARAVKYNVGRQVAALPGYRDKLLSWADMLPADCRLLCECHPGTALEEPEQAASFFTGMDADRFGIIIHVGNVNADSVSRWFELHDSRIQHVHVQFRRDEDDPATPAGRAALSGSLQIVKDHGFVGSLTLEFTRGIGRDEDIEVIYANACSDMKILRDVLA